MEPLVLVPGIQGRWEWMRRTVDALSVHFRVVTFSLRGNVDRRVSPIKSRRALDERKIDRAIVCGVSFGGRVALRFAATARARTSALVLVSTPGPELHLQTSSPDVHTLAVGVRAAVPGRGAVAASCRVVGRAPRPARAVGLQARGGAHADGRAASVDGDGRPRADDRPCLCEGRLRPRDGADAGRDRRASLDHVVSGDAVRLHPVDRGSAQRRPRAHRPSRHDDAAGRLCRARPRIRP